MATKRHSTLVLLAFTILFSFAIAADVPGERDSFPGWLGADYEQPPAKSVRLKRGNLRSGWHHDVTQVDVGLSADGDLSLLTLSLRLADPESESRYSALRMEASRLPVQELPVRGGVQPHYNEGSAAPGEVGDWPVLSADVTGELATVRCMTRELDSPERPVPLQVISSQQP